MRRNKQSRGWRRRTPAPGAADAATVFRELGQRELRDLETCRAVWEREGDPLALCEAIRHVDIPHWLADGLLVMITSGAGGYPDVRRAAWRERSRHGVDAVRAANVAMVRSQVATDAGATWDVAYDFGNDLSRERGIPSISAAGMKRVFERVAPALSVYLGRYYRARAGTHERVARAWSVWVESRRVALASAPARRPKIGAKAERSKRS